MINASNKYKLFWDMFIMLILVFISLAVPYRLAFIEVEPPGWLAAYWIIDGCFLLDIIMTFFTTITDKDS